MAKRVWYAEPIRLFIGGVEIHGAKSLEYSEAREVGSVFIPVPCPGIAGHFPHLARAPEPLPVAPTAEGYRRCPSCRLDVIASEFLGASCLECLKEG